jgi:hypothetical protein
VKEGTTRSDEGPAPLAYFGPEPPASKEKPPGWLVFQVMVWAVVIGAALVVTGLHMGGVIQSASTVKYAWVGAVMMCGVVALIGVRAASGGQRGWSVKAWAGVTPSITPDDPTGQWQSPVEEMLSHGRQAVVFFRCDGTGEAVLVDLGKEPRRRAAAFFWQPEGDWRVFIRLKGEKADHWVTLEATPLRPKGEPCLRTPGVVWRVVSDGGNVGETLSWLVGQPFEYVASWGPPVAEGNAGDYKRA